MKLLAKARLTIKKYKLLDRKDSILIALSGGPDSACLLYVLYSLKREFGLNLFSAHLNHMLRGKDSQKDLLFAQQLSKKLDIPFFYEEIDVEKKCSHASLEEAARNIRQDFLFRTADKVRATKIALGHTKDDQAETVLMRLLRGSGLYGLSAILPKRKILKHMLIRPLIEVTKEELLSYLKNKGISYRIDRTNKEDIYFRNRIRNRLIPELRKYNKNIVDILHNTAESASLDYEYLKKKAEEHFRAINNLKSHSRINLKTVELLNLHPALRRMIIRLSIERLKGSLRRIDYRHIQELEDLMENRKIGSIVDLPQGISVSKTAKLLKFYLRLS